MMGARLMFVTTHQAGLGDCALTPTEKRLFVTLAREVGRVETKEQLRRALGVESVRKVDSAAVTLRTKLQAVAADADHPLTLMNVWGVGYRLEAWT